MVAVLTGRICRRTDPRRASRFRDPQFRWAADGGRRAGRYALAQADVVRYVGEPVALVIAETRHIAEDGVEQVAVDYDDLPAVIGLAEAISDGAVLLHAEAAGNVACDFRYGKADECRGRLQRRGACGAARTPEQSCGGQSDRAPLGDRTI